MASDEMGYPEVNEGKYRRLQLNLARKGERGSEEQVEFLKAAGDTESFPHVPPGTRCLPL